MNETLCNNCKKSIIYIDTRKRGIIKCDKTPIEGIQASGRIVEVYLIHECEKISNSGASDKVLPEKNAEGRTWVGPDSHT